MANQLTRPKNSTSAPRIGKGCLGIRNIIDTSSIVIRKINERSARSGKLGMDRILLRLIDTPTKIRPVRAAADPPVVTNKSCHSSITITLFSAHSGRPLLRSWDSNIRQSASNRLLYLQGSRDGGVLDFR